MSLVVLHHGLWGCSKDVEYIEKRLLWRLSEARTLNITQNSRIASYDGIDVMGQRALKVIQEELSKGYEVNLQIW